ncbi:hypothetical protein C8R43DRAFT_974721 [Mycena crocata]|nr:hypothetical protein C8R43DRAFT_974721 [Mycena crocata]
MPVLTRRAHKAITRWLPNEIILEAIQHLPSYPDLLAVCRISQLFNGLATPLLYRKITLATPAAVSTCFATLKAHSGTGSHPRTHYVRQLALANSTDGDLYDELELTSELIKEMVPIFRDFCQLQKLELCVHGQVAPLLRGASFPQLVSFKVSVNPHFSEALRFFINGHPTLTGLELLRGIDCLPGSGSAVPELGALSLPNLRIFNGSGQHASGLVVTNQSLRTLTVVWHADDPSVVPALKALATAVSKDKPVGLQAFCGREVSCFTVLQAVAERLPDIAVLCLLEIFPDGRRISQATANQFAHVLRTFSALHVLTLCDMGASDIAYEESLEEDHWIVKILGEACCGLWSISLHGHEWSHLNTESWVMVG